MSYFFCWRGKELILLRRCLRPRLGWLPGIPIYVADVSYLYMTAKMPAIIADVGSSRRFRLLSH
jgi:hypothetical protein